MKTSDFDYFLPENLIAQSPLENRSSSKLLVLDKITGEIIHEKFFNIINYLNKGEEDTKASIEILLLKEIEKDVYECLARKQKRLKIGTKLIFSDELTGTVIELKEEGITHIKFDYDGVFLEIISKIGAMPLPPYIHEKLKDKDRYNTVYSKINGSAAAPTAGLHFTNELLEEIENKGIEVLYVTLHVGLGTFRPVNVEDVTKHVMHSEEYEITEEVANKLNKAKSEKRRIVCVGTTSVRTLESNISKYGEFTKTKEETSIFIYPGYKYKAVDALITNFHLPKSTLLMLVSALSSKQIIMDAYKEAIDNNYRFFSFGDAMFITNLNNNYKKIIKKVNSYEKSNYNYFKVIKGKNNILISAPHAYKHIRDGKVKSNEYNTSNIVKILKYFTDSHIIYTDKPTKEDPNFDVKNEYKNILIQYIKENNIKYFIDIHGYVDAKSDLIIGTNDKKNINNDCNLLENIYNIFYYNFSTKILIDKKYKASKKSLSKCINEETSAYALQFEINKNFRKMKRRKKSFNKTIKSLISVIKYIEGR